jgi:hypothetical protein
MKMPALLLPLIVAIGIPTWASAAPISGTTSLKVGEEGASGPHAQRQALESLNIEIRALEKQISGTRNQALALRAQPGARDNGTAASLEALATAYEMQKAEIIAKREALLEHNTAKDN